MSSLLYELYRGEYDIGTYREENEEKIARELTLVLTEVKAKFGVEFADRLSGLYVDQRALSDYRYYREGFALGVRLMLEAFTSATG